MGEKTTTKKVKEKKGSKAGKPELSPSIAIVFWKGHKKKRRSNRPWPLSKGQGKRAPSLGSRIARGVVLDQQQREKEL